MKIEGWDKINGFTYKGYVITNADFDFQANAYHADIFNLNDSNSRVWYLTLFADSENKLGLLRLTDLDTSPKSTQIQKGVTKQDIKELKQFISLYEELVDGLLEEKTIKVGGTTGIINQVMNAGTAVTYSIATPSSHSISNGLSNLSVMQQALNAMKELEEQLDKLKKEYPL